jgi:type II secretory pathway component GspD/PulD (secretin)
MSVSSNWIQEIGVDFRGIDNPIAPFKDLDDVTNGLDDQASRGLDNGGLGAASGTPSSGVFYNDGADGQFGLRTENFFGTPFGDNGSLSAVSRPLGSALSTAGGITTQLTFLNDLELSAILRAVEKNADFQLINTQILSVHNTQRSHVAVINQRAFIQDFDVEVAQFSAVADPQINVLHEGVVLDVRPTIHHNRKYLTLEIQPTVAKVVALRPFSTTLGGNTLPVIFELPELEVQSLFTSAVIPDGGSLLLGGLSNIRNVERRAEVPWLAKLPLVGFLLKQEGYSDENKSLMIVIRASITDARDKTEELENRMR